MLWMHSALYSVQLYRDYETAGRTLPHIVWSAVCWRAGAVQSRSTRPNESAGAQRPASNQSILACSLLVPPPVWLLWLAAPPSERRGRARLADLRPNDSRTEPPPSPTVIMFSPGFSRLARAVVTTSPTRVAVRMMATAPDDAVCVVCVALLAGLQAGSPLEIGPVAGRFCRCMSQRMVCGVWRCHCQTR